MRRQILLLLAVMLASLAWWNGVALASPYERAGWYTDLATYEHNVSGTVTIIDADTYRVDNFIYDGGGPAVYFYLAASLSYSDLLGGLSTGPLLSGTSYDGTTPLVIDLPGGTNLDGYNAIAVWCEDFQVDFGSGVFEAPEPSTLILLAIGLLMLTIRRARKTLASQ